MAGIGLSIKVDDKIIRRVFAGLEQRGQNLEPLLDHIGASLVTSTQDRFEAERGPDGKKWKPWSTAYAKRRRARDGKAKILTLDDYLSGSITHNASSDQVEVGSNMVYARIHQEGGQAGRNLAATIPARPFLGIDSDDEREIEASVQDYLAGAFKQ